MHQKNKIEINYIFYGFLFLFISATTIVNIVSTEHIYSDYRNFFIFHCIIQSLIEISLIILIGFFLEKFFPKYMFNIFIGLFFIFFLTHAIDFILIRIMDISIWHGLSFIVDETFSNFIELLTLTGISLPVWILLFLGASFIPLIGLLLYRLTKKISDKKPFSIKKEFFVIGSFSLLLCLFIWDLLLYPIIRPDIYRAYQKSLPWKTVFLPLDKNIVKLEKNLKKIILSKTDMASPPPSAPASKKPNIYIFIIESLREDFITKAITPNFHKFKKENVSFDLALSNSNNTPSSWFSILYSLYPFYWSLTQKNGWQEGSLPLNILKQEGYKINLLTSSGLHYYKMDELLFGKNKKLLNGIYYNNTKAEPHQSDLIAINKVIDNSNSEGNVFLVFLESSHFHYSWPTNFEKKFEPIIENLNPGCLTAASHKQLEAIKNRYKNALNYVDSLFGKFIASLREKNLFEDSIIVITADHGEEFFEKGHIFHASDLSHVQTHIPIYYKLGRNYRLIPKDNLKITTQVDIFPTVLDYLFGNRYSYPSNGQSLFQINKLPYAISTRYYGSRPPNEFFIHDGKNKVTLKFVKKNIFDSNELEVISIRDVEDNIKLHNARDEKIILSQVKKELEDVFSK